MTDFLGDLPSFFVTSEFAIDIRIDGVEAKGIYTPAFEDAFGIETRDKQLLIQESVATAIGVSHTSITEIIIDATTSTYHRVRGIEPDGTGLVMLTLENEETVPVGNLLLTSDGQDLLTSTGDNLLVSG